MISSTSGVLGRQPYARLFDSLDSDRNQGVSLDELKAARPGEPDEKINAAFGKLDSDGDGKLNRAEMTASPAAYDDEILKALVDLQAAETPVQNTVRTRQAPPARSWAQPLWRPESQPPRPAYVKTEEENATTAALFARADLNGDGLLSEDEFKIERQLTREKMLSSGYMPTTCFIPHDDNGDNLVSQDEVSVGHIMRIKPENIRFLGEQSPAEQDEAIARHEVMRAHLADFNAKFPDRARPIPPPLERETVEAAKAKRAAYEAEYAASLDAPEGFYKLSERLLGSLREGAKSLIDTPALSDLLAQRLMRDSLARLAPDPTVLAERITA